MQHPIERALVVGATGGIGHAVADALTARGVPHVHTLSRSTDGLDLTDEASIVAALDTLGDVTLDWVFVATGALTLDGHGPEKRLRDLDRDRLAAAFAVNAIGPALLLKHVAARLPRDRRAVFAALSARVGSIGDNRLGGWYGYRSSKAALNQLLHAAAIEIARKRPESIVALLHPGTIETPLTRPYARDRYTHTAEACAANLIAVLDGLSPEDSGGFWDYAGVSVPW